MPAAFSSPRSGAPLTTKSLRNADLGRLTATTRRRTTTPTANSERREQQLRAVALGEQAHGRQAARRRREVERRQSGLVTDPNVRAALLPPLKPMRSVSPSSQPGPRARDGCRRCAALLPVLRTLPHPLLAHSACHSVCVIWWV